MSCLFFTLYQSVFTLQIQKHLISDENKGYKRNSTNTMDQDRKKNNTWSWLLQCSKGKLLAGTNRLLQVCGDIEFWKILEDWKYTVYSIHNIVVFAVNHWAGFIKFSSSNTCVFYTDIPGMGLDKIERHTLLWEVAPLNSQSRNSNKCEQAKLRFKIRGR